MTWIVAIVPSLLLALAIASVHFSGNDKAPIYVLIALLLGSGISIVLFTLAFLRRPSRSLWPMCLMTLLPWIYVLGAIALSRAGLVDSIFLLGFR
jgi:hypothetical protein